MSSFKIIRSVPFHDYQFKVFHEREFDLFLEINDKMGPVKDQPVAVSAAPVAKEIPDIITDPGTKRTYERGKFLGKVRSGC